MFYHLDQVDHAPLELDPLEVSISRYRALFMFCHLDQVDHAPLELDPLEGRA